MAGVIFDGNTVAPAILVEKEIATTLFGAPTDYMTGSLDENGKYKAAPQLFTIDTSGLKYVGDGWQTDTYPDGSTELIYNTMSYLFHGRIALFGTIDLSNLRDTGTVSSYFEWVFAYTNIDTVYLPTMEESGEYDKVNLFSTFRYCDRITTVYIQNKKFANKVGCIATSYTFDHCSALENVYGLDELEELAGSGTFGYTAIEGELHFDSLTTMGSCNFMFQRTNITKLYFPALTTFSVTNPFGTSSTNCMHAKCTNLVEIHFRADAQATVEALTGYTSKFWAPDACTIYFDL